MLFNVFRLENSTRKLQRGFFTIGIPCPIGLFSVTDPLSITDDSNPPTNVAVDITHLWHDGSVKWLLAKGVATINANETRNFSIGKADNEPSTFKNPVKAVNNAFEIALGSDTLVFNASKPFCFQVSDKCTASLAQFDGQQYENLICEDVETFSFNVLRSYNKNVAVQIHQKGTAQISDKPLHVEQLSTLFLDTGDIISDITVTNPAASLHPNGQWDLGDPNAIHIYELSLLLNQHADMVVMGDDQQVLTPYDSTDIHQASSGKPNWQSPVHVGADDTVSLTHKGYVVSVNGEQVHSGDQCQPAVVVNVRAKHNYYVEMANFWQHFPSSISSSKNLTALSLLGAKSSDQQELQPGEQLTRRVVLSPDRLTTFNATLNPKWVHETNALPFTPFNANKAFQALIQQGVQGKRSFFAKRDEIDEYGWRHFGELYADHEKALAPHEPFFVSHYNNQYDPLCGMLNQWLITGDMRWKTLADDLAKHVANIDVYHTTLDKPEYSGGLFWHTDHYVKAHTATHRTYSKNQPSGVYEDHAGGGGPGGQHCYTNGLLHHYLLTGNNVSKQALLSVCRWIENYYEGDGTIVNALLSLKNAGSDGVKNVKTGQYPLDRGTGNYLQALMDKYTVLNTPEDLQKCAHIIENTVSPDDDISQRNFENVELTWFYTVFFQAVCRFIHIKERLEENDYAYQHAVKSLKHYVTWMLNSEYVYLEKPDILEFPNETWTGQDIRKLCLFAFAKAYLPELANAIEQKKNTMQKTLITRLANSEESQTTRVLCLMMQNTNFAAYEAMPQPMPISANFSVKKQRYRITTFLMTTLKNFSIQKERLQLVKRFPQLQKWLGKP
ncbi:hypothetical protein [Alteromonas sp. A079]|uniref:hypothetical protein n=1 Tax=Alteromonas sp. A079 TaxID=3410268 RepID=UPI003BA3AD13